MSEVLGPLALVTAYVGVLFLLADWGERRAAAGRRRADGLIYALSLAVYCTTWTFYGSVGLAARSGPLFLATYLGPTLAVAFWWSMLRRLVRIKNSHGITSIADFLAARYGKSQGVGALATAVVVAGLVPYLALQLKMMIGTVVIMAGRAPAEAYDEHGPAVGPPIALLMVLLTIVFGLRRLSPGERHPGMMVALSVESAVKLAGGAAAGVFVTFFLFDGMADLYRAALARPESAATLLDRGRMPDALTFGAHMLLSAAAILFLPRQFHVAVVENSDERHIRSAMWLLPLYLFAITLFAVPIATGGLALGRPAAEADTFVLTLPLAAGQGWLSWLVFLGGISAGAGMVMVETMTVSTMISNQLLLPLVDRVKALSFLRGNVRVSRWVAAALLIGVAYGYNLAFGRHYELASIGLVSFAAVLQFAPAIVGGLYWRAASRSGALLGLGAGFALWAYTLVLPVFVRAGWLPLSVLDAGPWGLELLRPQALFGLVGLEPLTHAVVWTLVFNVGLFVTGSLLLPARQEELRQGEAMVDVLTPSAAMVVGEPQPAVVDAATKGAEVERLLATYFEPEDARRVAAECLRNSGAADGRLSVMQLAQLEADVERTLAGAIGAAAAHAAVRRAGLVGEHESRELSRSYAGILARLRVSPAELRRKIDYHRERERLLAAEAERLRCLSDTSRRLSDSLEYDATAAEVARLTVPGLAEAALLYLEDGLPARVLVAHRDPEQEQRLQARLAQRPLGPQQLADVRQVLESGRPAAQLAAARPRWPAPLDAVRFESSLTLPLVARKRTVGTLSVFWSAANQLRYPDDLELLEEIARRGAIALDNAGLYRSARKAIEARDEFMAVASHELRTPLTPLYLQVQSLQRQLRRTELTGLPVERLEKNLQSAEAQVRRLAGLVENLLDVSRVGANRLRLTLEDVNLAEVAAEVVARHQLELRAARCSVDLNLGPDVCGRWDRLRVEQVVTNLLTNAIKYAPGHPIEVRVFRTPGMATLAVRDHGIGIAREDQERVFRPYERAVSYVKASGFGLGLYIVRQIVEAHCGRISLVSAPGEGSTFTVELPFEPVAEPVEAQAGEGAGESVA